MAGVRVGLGVGAGVRVRVGLGVGVGGRVRVRVRARARARVRARVSPVKATSLGTRENSPVAQRIAGGAQGMGGMDGFQQQANLPLGLASAIPPIELA